MLGQGDSESPALPMAEAEVMTDLTSRSTDDCCDPEEAAKEARPNPPRLPDPRDEESHMALSSCNRDKLCQGGGKNYYSSNIISYKRGDRSMPDYLLLPFPIFFNSNFFIDLGTQITAPAGPYDPLGL